MPGPTGRIRIPYSPRPWLPRLSTPPGRWQRKVESRFQARPLGCKIVQVFLGRSVAQHVMKGDPMGSIGTLTLWTTYPVPKLLISHF